MSQNNIVIGFILVLLFVFYHLKMDNSLVENDTIPEKVKNATNLGFVKPELIMHLNVVLFE